MTHPRPGPSPDGPPPGPRPGRTFPLLALIRSLAGNAFLLGLALICVGLDPWAALVTDR